MTIDDFASIFKFKGINIVLDEAHKEFAQSWANVVLGDYLMTAGETQFNLGKGVLNLEEKKHSPEAAPSGGLIIQ